MQHRFSTDLAKGLQGQPEISFEPKLKVLARDMTTGKQETAC